MIETIDVQFALEIKTPWTQQILNYVILKMTFKIFQLDIDYNNWFPAELMGPTRFERVTSRLSAVRSYLAKLRARPAVCISNPINNSFPVSHHNGDKRKV